MLKYAVIFVTAASLRQAKKIAAALVSERLAACVNMLPVASVFSWKDKIERSKEFLLVIKTKKINFNKVKKRVKSIHSYEVPEIIALPIIDANKEYLKWIDDVTK